MFSFLKKIFKRKPVESQSEAIGSDEDTVMDNEAENVESEQNNSIETAESNIDENQPSEEIVKTVFAKDINVTSEVKLYTSTEAIQKFFTQFNSWINNYINLDFSKFYNADYQNLISENLDQLEAMDLIVFKHQQIINKLVDDIDIKKSSFDLFAGGISMSDFTKTVLKNLMSEMNKIKEATTDNDKLILSVRDKINELRFDYNTNYDFWCWFSNI